MNLFVNESWLVKNTFITTSKKNVSTTCLPFNILSGTEIPHSCKQSQNFRALDLESWATFTAGSSNLVARS